MDPDECLKRIDEFLEAQKVGPEVDEWCQDLFEWLDKGGFRPDWNKYRLGHEYYMCFMAMKQRELFVFGE